MALLASTKLPTRAQRPARNVVLAAYHPVQHRRGIQRLATPGRRQLRSVSRAPVVVVQANIFARVVRLVKASVSQFVEQFEDPERLLDRVIGEMQEDLIKMRQATAKVKASEMQMSNKYKQAQDVADQWLKRAELAVTKGQDDLAREALMRRKALQTQADTLKKQLEMQEKAFAQLQANVRSLESKLTEALGKRDNLKARAMGAKANKQIQEMVGGLRNNSGTAWAAFEKMEEKVVALESEAESAGFLAAPDNLERQFQNLEGGGVEDELMALKRGTLRPQLTEAKMPAPATAAGRPLVEDVLVRDQVEMQLDELRRNLAVARKWEQAGRQ